MSTVNKYRFYCQTSSSNQYVWSLTAPTTCPENNAHTIDTGSITIVDKISTDIIKIQEESVSTGENFLTSTVALNIPAGATGAVTSVDVTWPMNVSMLELHLISEETHRGDCLNVTIAPDTITGTLGADVSSGGNEIVVSQTVIDNTLVGYYLSVTDGVNTDNLGRVLSIDTSTNTLTMENNLANSYLASSPTYVKQTIYTILDFEIGVPHSYSIGGSKIGGASIPANIIIRVSYTNKGTNSKKLVTQLEYLY